MDEKLSKAILATRIFFIVIFMLCAIGSLGNGIAGSFAGLLFVCGGLLLIQQVADLIPIIRNHKAYPIIAAIVLFFVALVITPKSEQSQDNSHEIHQDRSISFDVTPNETTATESATTITTTTTSTTTTVTSTTEATTTTAETTEVTTSITEAQTETKTQPVRDWVLNTDSYKFHIPSCRDVDKMSYENMECYSGTYDDVINMGYAPCGHCHPGRFAN